ncbi:TetR family transcriptional regulator [Rivihabitans pingtungensis]|jgi:TetR/AcrR family acrAB operon transcriptional repressor|uniref:TetR family transcriptional regulator n=1 Tax=Rivihabitans pingtungensis TaxID=1054498 RepID=UPI002CCBEA3A|nr:TetR family transcriptional regulator [Rivihabitans pingtungensis]HNX72042.1 TetR family transcriptional regulator [Rivihabitans pingtungensis]
MRRTKAEAEQTRNDLLDAAEQLFDQRGVSSTSLADIAKAAGVTRGAVYWHFTDKEDLLKSMCERTCLPFDHLTEQLLAELPGGALAALRRHYLAVFEEVVRSPRTRQVFNILWNKYECPDDNSPVMQRRRQHLDEEHQLLTTVLRAAREQGELRHPGELDDLAVILQTVVMGLIELWLADPNRFAIETRSRAYVDILMGVLGVAPEGEPKPKS